MIYDYAEKPLVDLKSQDNITSFLALYYSERFKGDEFYLEEKLERFNTFENKLDGLDFLLYSADDITREAFCNQSEVDFDDLVELQRIFRVL